MSGGNVRATHIRSEGFMWTAALEDADAILERRMQVVAIIVLIAASVVIGALIDRSSISFNPARGVQPNGPNAGRDHLIGCNGYRQQKPGDLTATEKPRFAPEKETACGLIDELPGQGIPAIVVRDKRQFRLRRISRRAICENHSVQQE